MITQLRHEAMNYGMIITGFCEILIKNSVNSTTPVQSSFYGGITTLRDKTKLFFSELNNFREQCRCEQVNVISLEHLNPEGDFAALLPTECAKNYQMLADKTEELLSQCLPDAAGITDNGVLQRFLPVKEAVEKLHALFHHPTPILQRVCKMRST